MNTAPKTYLVSDIKSFLKQLATVIRIKKIMRKEPHNQHLEGFSPEQLDMAKKMFTYGGFQPLENIRALASAKETYRAHHIAYCEFRGKSRSQIENKTSDGSPYPPKWVEEIKAKMLSAHAERGTSNQGGGDNG